MELSYTFWEAEEGGFIGFINQFPDYWTQGETIDELEKMLASLYTDMAASPEFKTAKEHTGKLMVAV
ncbi:MAG: type II toxin-antitoxin system HicB family antitoxin [Treponema sp.]|jgi:hypothetical protein|nr:type II toxin-antitoxin system HicB family antitoxin [Treponema sp.]